jgi:hypothetical protein
MASSMFFKGGILGLVALITISFISLVITFVRIPSNQIIINGDVIKSSSFGLSFYNNAGDILFSVSPLNDYFYINNTSDHLTDKIISSNNGNFVQNVLSSLKGIVFNREELVWNTNNSEKSVNYVVNQINGGVEIKRTINSKVVVQSIGQVIKFCSDCLVADDKNRAYFNADTVQQFDIDTAMRLNLTPVVIGENQFLPLDITKIKIIDRNNNAKIEIPVRGNQVFLQYKWRLLEFKANLGKDGAFVSQEVLLDE